ncbi:aminomethyl-transferring glycine dehydrogenase [Phycisphaerales bacterium AB-hyl4]|uniref:Glycine dehydrogenase (decarboxylating) n=1 Tax=Natronomicrosphaera hydrolytica TaxID=3242702 RepID=A0ABV4U716_9BACT
MTRPTSLPDAPAPRAVAEYEDAAQTSDSSVFASRHVGPRWHDITEMLATLGLSSLEELAGVTVPGDIRLKQPLNLDPALDEHAALAKLRKLAEKNRVLRSMIGQGYYDTHTPPVIQRNVLENPLWYTPYTPYQPEISQGRLEALLNYQTMVSDLTGLPVANASLLDEATAAAEAVAMCHGQHRGKRPTFYIAKDCHPQTLAVVHTRATSLGVDLQTFDPQADTLPDFANASGVLVQYPTTDGRVENYDAITDAAHADKALVVVATDLLALTLLRPPGEFGKAGADIAVGSSQRFGVPMGFGGPHAAFMSVKETYVRKMPGRLVGVSKDANGKAAFRLAIQTREQHIKRDKATSNICTAQVLLAIIAGMYAVWHGPQGLTRIARRTHAYAAALAEALRDAGHDVVDHAYFDTITVNVADADAVLTAAVDQGVNVRKLRDGVVCIACDETTTTDDLTAVIAAFSDKGKPAAARLNVDTNRNPKFEIRNSPFLTHEIFHRYRSETDLMRYITRLQERDVSLCRSMIPLGSCTMKLNAAAEMMPVTWPEFASLHPYAPSDQTQGYAELFADLERWLAEITGLPAVSLQPNAGSQGEYAGLMAIRGYHHANGNPDRNVCLIPTSAHGTNPASAVIAGMKVVPVGCDDAGNIDLADLRAKAEQHADHLAALMVTYPSTHGVFETTIREVCAIVHEHGGQVYLDGANMNAQVGLTRPAECGADVVHLNLHKTFCIPHGGGGPGMGPICAAEHLRDYLPISNLEFGISDLADAGSDTSEIRNPKSEIVIAAAPYGSPMILPIPWMYIAMMGETGLRQATEVAILNANYMAKRLEGHYDILYTGPNGRVAHEFIMDCRPFQKSVGITVEDIAKRLIDFGFHSPTMSWPVAGTLMCEPTESESRDELDRFCDALIAIRAEIRAIETGEADREDNVLKHAPHPAEVLTADEWPHVYSRQLAAYPLNWVREWKYWPPVSRIDQAWGDRNLVCACPPMSEYCDL